MIRVKYETTTTGTGNLTMTIPTGYQSLFNSIGTGYDTDDKCIYTLLDADGTNWEYGYGTISIGNVLSRLVIFESTNGGPHPTGNAINLSAGTHTVLINRGHFSGSRIMSAYEPSADVTFSTAETDITFAQVYTHPETLANVDGVSYMPGHANGTVAAIVNDPASELPYHRGWRVTLCAQCDTTSAGNFWGLAIDPINWASSDPTFCSWAPLRGTGTVLTVSTPVIDGETPQKLGRGQNQYYNYANMRYSIFNTSGSNITVSKIILFVEWMI